MSVSTLRFFLVALFASAALAACGGGDAGNGGGAAKADEVPDSLKYGGTVTVGAYGDLQSMNGLVSSDMNSNSIQRELLFMPLVKYDEKLNPVPWLAEAWDTVRVKPDTLELTFRLRRDVKWHDGRPTTARDVLFTFERAVDPATAFPNASAFDEYDKRAVLVDDYTIKFRLRPHADFLDIWYQTPPMPEHLLGKVPAGQLQQHPFQYNPVGNGPFRFVRRQAQQQWIFEANPDFPAALGGRPFLDRVVWRFIPEQTTLLTDLLTGAIDVYMSPNPAQAQQIKNTPSLTLIESPFRQWVWIGWNGRNPLFADARVRRALTMAIDRRQIVDALVYGYGDIGRGTVTPAHWSYDPNDPQTLLPYDTAQARRLLAEAGWADRNGDGVIENAQGRPFRFTMKTNDGNDLRRDIIVMVQAQLARVGIQVQPQLVEWTTMISQLQGNERPDGTRQREVEAVVSSWVDYFRKDDRDILHCGNLEKPYQYVGYCNPRVDQYLDTLAIMTDREAARPIWKEYQHFIVQESPYTVLYYPRRITGVNRRLNGVQMDVRGEFNTVRTWWLDPGQRRARGNAAPRPGAAPPESASRDTQKR
jgi:peptide/nickel transport system substrate-binding protein